MTLTDRPQIKIGSTSGRLSARSPIPSKLHPIVSLV